VTPPLPSNAPASPERPDEPLATVQAFRRFVTRVTLRAGRWLANRGVPADDRDDVLQDALVQAYKKRGAYDPALGSWEAWAFGFVGQVVRNYRKARGRRLKRVDVARVDLPDVPVDGPNPEEETEEHMMQALRDRCMASLDEDDRAILLARAEGIPVKAIATSFGVSESTAYVYIKVARERLQAALDREQGAKRALGVAVLPFTIDQLIGPSPAGAAIPTKTMRRVWKQLDRLMADDVAAGRLQDDGTEVERYMGTPDSAPRPNLLGRALRALGPRGISALTHLGVAAVSVLVTYAIMRPTHQGTTKPPAAASSVVARIGDPGDVAPTATAAPSAAGVDEARADAGAAGRADAGTAERDEITEEQALFDTGSNAYSAGRYADAIAAFQEQARKHPRSQYAGVRDRLLILSLIGAHRKAEASARIERLRRASPESAIIQELEAALRAAN
jgi:RNA polymerase sigma-70 factor (ECF subfamily)